MVLQLVTKVPESKLMQMVGDLRSHSAGWHAMHFHLSKLLEEYKSEYQIKIAINLIHDLLKNHDGSLFVLSDGSIVVVCHKLEKTLMEKLIFQLRYLYMDDPLCYNESGQENPDFCSIYDLKHDWQAFDRLCSNYIALIARNQALEIQANPELYLQPSASAAEPSVLDDETTEKHKSHGGHFPKLTSESGFEKSDTAFAMQTNHELNATKLLTIEQALRKVDLRAVTRRQPVCAVLSDMKIRRVFDELYIHISHLRQLVKTDVDFFGNRWLFKYLTSILDRRMIDLIRNNPGNYLTSPISINLNVETLLSSWFADFSATIKPETRVSLVIEVPVIDLFADMRAFKTAMTEAQKLGYRVCLDGLSTESFISIDREKMGLDLIKVQWNADLLTDLKSKENTALATAIAATGNNRIILCRCDNRSALEYGIGLGISLFQGRYLDGVLNPTSKVEN